MENWQKLVLEMARRIVAKKQPDIGLGEKIHP